MVTKAEKAAELLMQSVVHSKLPILKKSLYYICFPSNRIRTFSNVNFSSLSNGSLFRKKRFEINFFVQQNASKFAIFYTKMYAFIRELKHLGGTFCRAQITKYG